MIKKQNEGTPKRVTYGQLEKQNKNGKELLYKVTQRMAVQTKTIEALKGQLQSAQAMIGTLTFMYLKDCTDTNSVTISKPLIADIINNYNIRWTETECKLAYNIEVIEKEYGEDESELIQDGCQDN